MKSIYLSLLSTITALGVYAQKVDVSTVSPTSAPAFTVLGISPTEIARPNTWNKLQASLYQNLVDNSGAAPKNFALEFKPYWLSDHPKFTFQHYLEKEGFSLRNLSLSVASAKAPYSKDTAQTLGFGFRLPIILANAKRKAISEKLSKELETFQNKITWQSDFIFYITEFRGKKVSEFLSDMESKINHPPAGNKLWKNVLQIKMLKDTLAENLKDQGGTIIDLQNDNIIGIVQRYISKENNKPAGEISEKIKDALNQTPNLQLSGALSLAFPTEQFNYSKFSQAAVWIDYTTKFAEKSPVEGTAALRYVRTFATDSVTASSNFDFIGKLNFGFGSEQKFSISVWAVLRNKSNDLPSLVINNITYTAAKNLWDNKYGLDLSYKLSNTFALSYSFGKDYKLPLGAGMKGNQLISFLNLFYSLNTKVDSSGELR